MERRWDDKVVITREEFFTLLRAYTAKLVMEQRCCFDEEEILHVFFDILKDSKEKTGDV